MLGKIGGENAHSNLFPKRDRAKDAKPFFAFLCAELVFLITSHLLDSDNSLRSDRITSQPRIKNVSLQHDRVRKNGAIRSPPSSYILGR